MSYLSFKAILQGLQALANLTNVLTPEFGFCVWLVNKTGAPSVKGTVVEADAGVDMAFTSTGASCLNPIGVVYDAGVADG